MHADAVRHRGEITGEGGGIGILGKIAVFLCLFEARAEQPFLFGTMPRDFLGDCRIRTGAILYKQTTRRVRTAIGRKGQHNYGSQMTQPVNRRRAS